MRLHVSNKQHSCEPCKYMCERRIRLTIYLNIPIIYYLILLCVQFYIENKRINVKMSQSSLVWTEHNTEQWRYPRREHIIISFFNKICYFEHFISSFAGSTDLIIIKNGHKYPYYYSWSNSQYWSSDSTYCNICSRFLLSCTIVWWEL